MDECLFCKMASGEIKPDIVYQDDRVLGFRDINPAAPVHVLLIPKEHVNDASTVDDGALLAALFAAGRSVAEAEGILATGYRLVANVGRDAGQSVFHLHVHLLGGRSMGWPPG